MKYSKTSCLMFIEKLLIAALIILAITQLYSKLYPTKEDFGDIPSQYPYTSFIKSPEDMGGGTKGDYDTLEKDIKALGKYGDLLLSGYPSTYTGSASTTGGPLGNAYVVETGGDCTASNGDTKSRYVYINNIPTGKGVMGLFVGDEGLVPGIIEDLEYIDPSSLFGAFESGTPSCTQVSMYTRDNTNTPGVEEVYISDTEIDTYNSCWFQGGKNPINGNTCDSPLAGFGYGDTDYPGGGK